MAFHGWLLSGGGILRRQTWDIRPRISSFPGGTRVIPGLAAFVCCNQCNRKKGGRGPVEGGREAILDEADELALDVERMAGDVESEHHLAVRIEFHSGPYGLHHWPPVVDPGACAGERQCDRKPLKGSKILSRERDLARLALTMPGA
jgi:hypothetical protein